VVVAVAAVAAGGIGAVGAIPGTATAATRPTTASVVSSETTASNGTFLAARTTVYTRTTNRTACSARCLESRPPVLLPHRLKTATAGPGVDGSKLGTAPAAHGALQVTYAGKRLYWFVKDTAPGQVHGSGGTSGDSGPQ
jgi:predicted lipoprotein with Yx(FWY)xxD motif